MTPFVLPLGVGPRQAFEAQSSPPGGGNLQTSEIPVMDDMRDAGSDKMQPIQFVLTAGSAGTQCLRDGWATPEGHGTWTVGPRSVLLFDRLATSLDYACRIPMGPFLHPPQLVAQDIRIEVNGVEVHASRLTGNLVVDFVIAAWVMERRSPVEMVIHCSTPTSPGSFAPDGSPSIDVRKLGLSIWGVTFTPRAPADLSTKPAPYSGALGPVPRVAAVTMVFNESVYLPIWLAHNARQVGIENCYVIDHGSTDGSTANLGACNVVRIPRSPYDPAKQSEWNSGFCSSLLTWFDWVIYSDVDEILMADPAEAETLVEYCRRPLPEIVTAIGLNTLHLVDDEPTLDLSRPVSVQRPYVFGCASMCKPLLIKRRVEWSPGSHSANAPVVFDQLYMFHLRWFDLDQGLQRLQKTRAMAWAQEEQGRHQRVEDAQLVAQMRGFGGYPRYTGVEFDPTLDPVKGFVRTIQASTVGRENDLYKVDLDIWYPQLWHLPERFIGRF